MDKLMTRKDYDKWVASVPLKVCTFCEWKKYQVVLKEFENWVWIANIAPYWRYHTMILSKRHFLRFSDMSFKEAGELTQVIDYGEKKILDAKLKRKDGTLIEKVVYFWRFRLNAYDPISGTTRNGHFHLHLAPDKDHLWDPIVDPTACKIDMSILK